MKPIPCCCLLTVALSVTCSLRADGTTTALSGTYRIVSRGANHRTWERIENETRPDGSRLPRVHRVMELATGMHFKDADGAWVESREEIEPVAGGAVARQGQHQVSFAANLNTPSAIELTAADGKRLRSTILGLGYFDSSSGKS